MDDKLAHQIWPSEDPVGKHMGLMLGHGAYGEKTPWMKVVGVVRPVKNYGVDQPSRFESYVPNAQFPGRVGNWVLRSSQHPEHLEPAMR